MHSLTSVHNFQTDICFNESASVCVCVCVQWYLPFKKTDSVLILDSKLPAYSHSHNIFFSNAVHLIIFYHIPFKNISPLTGVFLFNMTHTPVGYLLSSWWPVYPFWRQAAPSIIASLLQREMSIFSPSSLTPPNITSLPHHFLHWQDRSALIYFTVCLSFSSHFKSSSFITYACST